jgi:flagellar biosynthetic protein FliR
MNLTQTLVPAPAMILSVMLVSLRLTAMLLMTPLLAGSSVPSMVRIILIMSLSICLTLGIPAAQLTQIPDLGQLVIASGMALSLGASMGLGIALALAAYSIGGRLLDVQIGFGIGQVFDPVTRRQLPILTTLLNQLAIALFFCTDAIHTALRWLAQSFVQCPPLARWSIEDLAPALFKQVAGMFSLGFAVVAPVVLGLLLVEFSLGVLTRQLPQLQMFAFALPLKILVGLAALAFWCGSAPNVFTNVISSTVHGWKVGV